MLRGLSVIQAENLYIVVSVFLNAVCAYALVFDMVRVARASRSSPASRSAARRISPRICSDTSIC